MPAQVTVAAGASAGKQLWIEKQVLRIGSDPDADLCLPSSEIESQVVMVEFDRGKYVVYNRSRRDLMLADRPLPAGQNAPWPAEKELDVGGGYRLVLQVEGNPAPAPRQARQQLRADVVAPALPTDAPPPNAAAPAAEADGNNSLMQIGVIAVCVLGCIGMILFAPKKETKTSDCPPFEQVLTAVQKAESVPRPLVARFQEAQAVYRRQRLNTAREQFLKLRDEAQQLRPTAVDTEAHELLLKYLKCRILQLTT